MTIRVTAAVVACAIVLAACGSKKEASESNFSEVLDNHFARACVQVDPGNLFGSHSYPASVAMTEPGTFFSKQAADEQNARATAPFNALVSAGLLAVRDGQTQAQFGAPGKMVPAKIYSLTDAGSKALADQQNKNGTGFCAGHFKVKSIVRFTPPSDALGHTISEVVYSYNAVDVPAWAQSKEIAASFPRAGKMLSGDLQGQSTLVLASDGWIMSEDFSRQ
ncbi:hypothetical protein [Trinickia mobilis]|uniref:hypothetical protein n=1 Tax=Trinickia mobilis TaxID=2816356 RepID=UPI001A8E1DFE|nr:hypothetical protein [Trinickia mobilis]